MSYCLGSVDDIVNPSIQNKAKLRTRFGLTVKYSLKSTPPMRGKRGSVIDRHMARNKKS